MTAFDADLRSLAAQTTLSRRTVIATSLATGFALAVQPVAAQTTIDFGLVIPDESKTLREGAIRPWQTQSFRECQDDMEKYARKRGIPLDVPSLGVDYYVANLHKWAFVPRSSGFLWAAPERQPGLHPTVISWGLDQGFTTEFDWVGTRDPAPFLAAPEGIAMMREMGVDAVWRYTHGLARGAARLGPPRRRCARWRRAPGERLACLSRKSRA